MCEHNYFPKKIKVAYSVNLQFPALFCSGLDVFTPDFGQRAESTKMARGGIPPPPSGQKSMDCLLTPHHSREVRVPNCVEQYQSRSYYLKKKLKKKDKSISLVIYLPFTL